MRLRSGKRRGGRVAGSVGGGAGGTLHWPGATIAAASASLADVQTAVNAAADGDTVTIPNGSATWAGGITTTKQIRIRALNLTPTPNGATSRNVVITNNSATPLFNFTTGNSYHCGLAGIQFVEGTGDGAHFACAGNGTKPLLAYDLTAAIRTRFFPAQAGVVWEALGGVLWNTRVTGSGASNFGAGWLVKSPRAWTTAPTMGAADVDGNVNVYAEDCTFIGCSQFPDIDDNGRFVMRYCYLDGTWGLTHGFTSLWGGRHFEFYNNTFDNTQQPRDLAARYFWCRAGTGVMTDNVVNNAAFPGEYGAPVQLAMGDNTTPSGGYPMNRQPGGGHNGSAYVVDPIYLWNNTGARAGTAGVDGAWSTHVQVNRDYFTNTAKPGYSKFTYPHPLRDGAVDLVNRWSNPATWGGSLPGAADPVVLAAGQTVTLDTNAVAQSVIVNGLLVVDPAVDVSLTANWLRIGPTGELRIGTAANRYTRNAVITLNGAQSNGPSSNRFVPDETGRTGAGNGRLARLFGSTGAVAETITVTFTSATAFNVSGSVSGSLGSGTTGTLFNNRIRFIATPGATPWANGHTITVTVEQRARANAGLQRGLNVEPGGKLRLHGAVKTARTRLNANAAASAASFTLADAVTGWASGEQIVIGGSDFRDAASGASELLTVNSVGGTALSTTTGVSAARYGTLQYATDAGMSLSPGTLTKPGVTPTPDWDATPKVLDERAPVINLTRNIVIQAPNDSDWTANGFGVHVMAMGRTSTVQIDGVEIRRGGQRGNIGRYPFHWHLASYNLPDGGGLPSDGAFLGNATGQYVRNLSVNRSVQRAVVIHGTHGVEVSDCVAFDIEGHAFFMEEGAEEDCTIQRNVAMKVRTVPNAADALIHSDMTSPPAGQTAGAAGFWLSNPKNTFRDNWAFDCENWGILNGWAMSRPIGQSQEVAIVPNTNPVTEYRGNVASGCGKTLIGAGFLTAAGIATAFPHFNNRGSTVDARFGVPDVEFVMSDNVIYKCMPRGYFNRVERPTYRGWTQADNERFDFVGQAASTVSLSRGEQCLLVGESLNNATSRAAATIRAAVTSYHELLFFRHSIFVNYPYRAPGFTSESNSVPVSGGAVGLGDLYTDSMFTFNDFIGLKLVGTQWGTRVRPPHLGDGNPLGNRHWTFAGAIRDVNGEMDIGGAGRHWIYDVPFLTYQAADLQDVAPAGNNEKSTSTRYYGVIPQCNGAANAFRFELAMSAYRLNPADQSDVGSWVLADASSSIFQFHHFSAAKAGHYRVTFPGTTVAWVSMRVQYAELTDDEFVMAVQFNGGAPTHVYETTDSAGQFSNSTPPNPTVGGNTRIMSPVGSIAAVVADSTASSYYYEAAQNRVWVKHKGGLAAPGTWFGGAIGQRQKTHYIAIK